MVVRGPSRLLGLASQISKNDNFLHMPRHNNSVFVRNKCPPPSTVMSNSIKQDLICRSGRSVLLKKKKGSNTRSSLPRTQFLGLHGVCWMSATNQYQLIWQMIFYSVRFSAL